MSRLQWFIAAWRIMFVAGVSLEMAAFLNGQRDDTLSERVARIQHAAPLFRWLLAGFMVWLTYHFATARVLDGAVAFRWSGRELLQAWAVAVFAWAVVTYWPRW